MPTYNLIFHEDDHGVDKRVELEGQNVACVFSVVHGSIASVKFTGNSVLLG